MTRSSFILLLWCTSSILVHAQSVYFIDIGTDTMKVGNTLYYELGIRKSNGSIAYLIDKTTGQKLMRGSRYEQLWGVVFSNSEYFGGFWYSPTGPNYFTYQWDSTSKTLILQYIPEITAKKKIIVTVDVKTSDQNYFDLRLQFLTQWGDTLARLLFPSDLVFNNNDIQEVLLPIIPGIKLKSSFFADKKTYGTFYPGSPGVFSDFVSFTLTTGSLTHYLLIDSSIIPVIGLKLWPDDEYITGSRVFTHEYLLSLPDSSHWTSPTTRIRVGISDKHAIESFRVDNSIDKITSIRIKEGTYYDRVIKAPLLKCDFPQLRDKDTLKKFSQYDNVFSKLPVPSIIHPVAYMPGGHDHSYPDFLPPDTSFGTAGDFKKWFENAQRRGIMVMPYTNPTWWDPNSQTLKSHTEIIDSIAVINLDKTPRYETYNRVNGVVVSPRHPFVLQRLGQFIQQLTVDVPSDFLFQDQIGARGGLIDLNSTSPTSYAYLDTWIKHCETYKSKRLATELGFDRLLNSHVSFHGNVMEQERAGSTDSWWGKGNWEYYPYVTMLAGDKALFYEHDLDESTMITNKENLRWDLTHGFMFTYNLTSGYDEGSEWMDVAEYFQAHIASRYAGKLMKDFTGSQTGITASTFEGLTIISNWDTTASYQIDGHTVSRGGVYAKSSDGRLIAGVFTALNNVQLSTNNDDHYLIIELLAGLDSLVVYRPSGPDVTTMKLQRPVYWLDSAAIHLFAETKDTAFELTPTITQQSITFNADKKVSMKKVLRYVLTYNTIVAAEMTGENRPKKFALTQNYPNPFNPSTSISFKLPTRSFVSLKVFDALGRKVATIISEEMSVGSYTKQWDAVGIPSGVYFYRLHAGNFIETKKLILLK
jgi:hypothetical protein